MGRKFGASDPFWGGGLGSPSSTMWPDSIGRTVLQTVTQKLWNMKP